MILGIDVGSTHTDGALIRDREILATAKSPTEKDNLFSSLKVVTERLITPETSGQIERIVLSTTVSTNAVVEGKLARTGVILINGPGLAPEHFNFGKDTYFLRGYVNHRGRELAPVDPEQIREISDRLAREGIKYAACAGKFSTRNPIQEKTVREKISGLRQVSLSHELTGRLNFPRRAATAYLNAAVFETYNDFLLQVLDFFKRERISVPFHILKADGGTFRLESSGSFPIQTILSGPAASIMGILASLREKTDSIGLDIGGTTTDIAFFARGAPLLMPAGVAIGGYKTGIRGLRTRSIGIGGDSRVARQEGRLKIGPRRDGPAAALGGPSPTPTDALVALDLVRLGRRDLASEALAPLAGQMGLSIPEVALAILKQMAGDIAGEIAREIAEIDNQPVYTIHEYLEGERLTPKNICVVGGPAAPLAPLIGQHLGLPFLVPPQAEVANAVGAALARTTTELTLLADTESGTLTLAEEGYTTAIPSRFSLNDARRLITEKLKEKALSLGADSAGLDIEITEEQVYPVVRNYYRSGENIRLKAQIKPGLAG